MKAEKRVLLKDLVVGQRRLLEKESGDLLGVWSIGMGKKRIVLTTVRGKTSRSYRKGNLKEILEK